MKCVMSLILLIIFMTGFSSCSVSQKGATQMQDSSKPTQTSSLADLSMEPDGEILSKEYAIAEKALVRAVLEKDKETLKLGLKSQFFPIKQKTVEAITEIEDKTFVPDLINAFQENQSIFSGGTETKIMQDNLNKAIAFALEKLTGSSAQDINSVSNSEVDAQSEILSKDRLKAEIALVKAIQAEDRETIRLGLKNENLLIKKKAVTSLVKVKDKQSVPDLIEVLSENQVVLNGGNEIAAMQADLNRDIVISLRYLTGLKFDVSEALSSDDINKVLEESRKWWSVNRNNDK
jgi:HEAT repeat protein